jgi:bacterioferritin-associated ferredoxin
MHRTKKEQEIIEGLKPVCICKGIKARVFQERIKAGLTTVEELKKATGAGCGSCKGNAARPVYVRSSTSTSNRGILCPG